MICACSGLVILNFFVRVNFMWIMTLTPLPKLLYLPLLGRKVPVVIRKWIFGVCSSVNALHLCLRWFTLKYYIPNTKTKNVICSEFDVLTISSRPSNPFISSNFLIRSPPSGFLNLTCFLMRSASAWRWRQKRGRIERGREERMADRQTDCRLMILRFNYLPGEWTTLRAMQDSLAISNN